MSTSISVDVRFIAATNRDLHKEVIAGRYREDLFYRLNVVEIKLTSLSEWKEDISLLVEHFINQFRHEMKKDIQGVDSTAVQLLMQHEWKGEIRELENIVERSVIFCNDKIITANDLPEFFHDGINLSMPENHTSLEGAMNNLERQYIHAKLRKHNFNKESTAQALNISLPTLYRRIKDLEIPLE